jgi:hypothetical protein
MITFVYVFLLSFILNLFWENAHARLYVQHLNKKITERVLIIATLGDAVIITGLSIFFYYLPFLRERVWLSIPIGIVIAIVIELYALSVHRWAYNKHMPIIPLLNVGLTPTIQLGILGYVIFAFLL